MVRRRWMSSTFVLFVVFVGGTLFVVASAPFNLNLKSSTLSRMLSGRETKRTAHGPQPAETEPPPARNEMSNLINLDLAGECECLVAGPAAVDAEDDLATNRPTRPLFGIKKPAFPKASVAFRYNLAKLATYPIPMVLCRFRGQTKQKQAEYVLCLAKNIGAESNSVEATLRYRECAFDRDLALQYDSDGKAALQLRLPMIRNRLNIQLRTSMLPKASEDRLVGFLNARIPPQIGSGENDSWWIPDVILSPSGLATASSEGSYGGVGFRFMVRRPIGWSLFGGGSSVDSPYDDVETTLRLEFQRLGRAGQRLSTVRFQAELEEFLESARCTLMHELVSTWSE